MITLLSTDKDCDTSASAAQFDAGAADLLSAYMRYLILLSLLACGSSQRSFADIRAAIAAPTGSGRQNHRAGDRALHHQTRTALVAAIGVVQTRVPVNYGISRDTIYATTCTNQPTDGSQQTSTADLSTVSDAGTTGTVSIAFGCLASTYDMSITFHEACTSQYCFDGTLRIELAASEFTWALLVNGKVPGASTTTVVDMGGEADVTDAGFSNDRVVAFFGTPKPQPVLLTWSAPGTNSYSEFFLTGATHFICHIGDNKTCDQLDANGNATGAPELTW